MEEFVTRADLLPRERMVALSRKTNVQGLAHLALHTIALAVTGALVWQADSTWWVGPAILQSVSQVRAIWYRPRNNIYILGFCATSVQLPHTILQFLFAQRF